MSTHVAWRAAESSERERIWPAHAINLHQDAVAADAADVEAVRTEAARVVPHRDAQIVADEVGDVFHHVRSMVSASMTVTVPNTF